MAAAAVARLRGRWRDGREVCRSGPQAVPGTDGGTLVTQTCS